MRILKTLIAVFVAVVLCAAGGQPINAQETGRIVGTVTDADSSTPIVYANVVVLGTNLGGMSGPDGKFKIPNVPPGTYTVRAMMMGFKAVEKRGIKVKPGEDAEVNFELDRTIVMKTQEIVVTDKKRTVEFMAYEEPAPVSSEQLEEMPVESVLESVALKAGIVKQGDEMYVRGGRPHARGGRSGPSGFSRCPQEPWNTESYDAIAENEFRDAIDHPFSTFSIDVDAASYSNVRRFVDLGGLPPADAVRIEELINYFSYDYPDPSGSEPFSITTEVAGCPWNEDNKLVHVGLQGKRVELEDLPPNNLVFLLDVSGSMQPYNKLPLLKRAFRLLTDNLRAQDRVAIVVYAGAAGLVLPSTPGDQKEKILEAIDRLHAGGTTAGGAGIKLAYDVAAENFIKDGNNRVILATDGDFNTGVSSDAEMVRLIEEKRKSGVFITVLGFGEANLKDSKMEKIADHGNGHYAYIDNIFEARKVLVNELGATLLTIAKDVKIQVEFNPAKVESYRLVGYENRMLKKEDFDNDKKDAGDIGAGHSVTALYEVVPVSGELNADVARRSTYTTVSIDPVAFKSSDVLTVRFRYKKPDEDTSRLIQQTLQDNDRGFEDASEDFRFAAAVAEFGMLLRDSQFKADAAYDHVLQVAKSATGDDSGGYRHEFVRLVEKCRELSRE